MGEPVYYDKKKLYGLKYIQLPKALLVSDRYRNLSAQAKIAWALFLDRYKLSAANGFEESYGHEGKKRVYFYFTMENLMAMLNVRSKTTAAKIKKELIDAHLIEVKRVGLNSADKIYLLEPEITEDDIYRIDEIEKDPQVPEPTALQKRNKVRHEAAKKGDETRLEARSPENGLQRKTSSDTEVQKMDFSETPHGKPEVQKMDFSETPDAEPEVQKMDPNNIDTVPDTKRETKKETKERSVDLELEQMYKDGLKADLPPYVFKILNKMSKTYDEMSDYVGLLYRAKHEVEKKTATLLTWETDGDVLDRSIYETLSRAFRVIRRREKTSNGRPVASPANYLYTSLVRCFYAAAKALSAADPPDRNWLDSSE